MIQLCDLAQVLEVHLTNTEIPCLDHVGRAGMAWQVYRLPQMLLHPSLATGCLTGTEFLWKDDCDVVHALCVL